ncbi:uncharacterized protein N7503_007247 [Penicillium pulvis]|uniref:uncharacterized protein n=1 Tax=Penicillium pulvis TaxID=1562058 RepID=UPI0025465AC6|nr:uncharacterized protein N7503_007247 [Penicillium pulvis]KAJ5797951.1 hypothetical protein N7503_007247 [Penicillium pulvis]
MQTVQPHPARQPPARFARKYGPTFNTFDHLANISLCSQELGPIHIDCRFRHSKTQLGVLGPAENQAGILYVDFAFSQPKDCHLTSAVIWISLEEEEEEEKQQSRRHGPRERIKPATISKSSQNTNPQLVLVEPRLGKSRFLQLTHDFGPRQLEGKPTNVTTKNVMHLTPELNVLGNGGGGLGCDREQTFTQSSRWTFTGNLLPGSRFILRPQNDNGTRAMVYRTLKWELSGDDFSRQSTHSNVIQTAFTLEHDMDPFYIRVEIQGKLKKGSGRFKSNVKQLLRFPRQSQQKDAKSLILVFPDKDKKPIRRLDPIVKGLPLQMERLNFEGLRVQLPDSLPVSFRDSSQAVQDSNAEKQAAMKKDRTDPVVYTESQKPNLPKNKPLERLPSPIIRRPSTLPPTTLPITQFIPYRPQPKEEPRAVAHDYLLVSPKPEQTENHHNDLQYSMHQTQIRCRTEGKSMLATSDTPLPKPVPNSPRVVLRETPPDKDLGKLAVQLAQFPVLILILECHSTKKSSQSVLILESGNMAVQIPYCR